MVDKKTVKRISQMSNKDLIRTANKINYEKKHPETYGKHGTSRYVTDSEFWGGHHSYIKQELQRRKNLGMIKKSAAVHKSRNNSPFGFSPGKNSMGIGLPSFSTKKKSWLKF
jgi:hypothetical protein